MVPFCAQPRTPSLGAGPALSLRCSHQLDANCTTNCPRLDFHMGGTACHGNAACTRCNAARMTSRNVGVGMLCTRSAIAAGAKRSWRMRASMASRSSAGSADVMVAATLLQVRLRTQGYCHWHGKQGHQAQHTCSFHESNALLPAKNKAIRLFGMSGGDGGDGGPAVGGKENAGDIETTQVRLVPALKAEGSAPQA